MMSVILKLKNVVFNNSNLPKLPRLYKDGLVAAFRPGNSAGSLADLSGNGVSLTQVGTPNFNEFGVQVSPVSGYTTDVVETPSFSMVVAYRYEVEIGSITGTMQVIGSRDNVPNPDTGASITAGLFADDDSTGTRIQHSLSLGTSGSMTNIRGTKIAQPVPGTPYLSPWQYMIATYDSTNREYHLYEPAKSSEITGTAVNTVIRSNNVWSLSAVGGATDNGATCTIAEALFYNKVLSSSEVSEIYGYSVDYLTTKGIVLAE